MDICRYLTNNVTGGDKIPSQLYITSHEWQTLIELLDDLVYFAEYANFEQTPDYENTAILLDVNAKELARLKLFNGKIRVFYKKISDDLLIGLNNISERLGALLLINPKMEFPKSKIISAQKRLDKKAKVDLVEYQQNSFGQNNIWLAIKANYTEVLTVFNLTETQVDWHEALLSMRQNGTVFMCEFRGWTFLAGQNLTGLFAIDATEEEEIEKCHVDRLLEWAKSFMDIQLYMQYERSMYFNAFYRVLNGKLIYGEYQSDTYQIKHGTVPKNIENLPDNNASTIASEWSFDPDHLRFRKETENAKAWIVKIPIA